MYSVSQVPERNIRSMLFYSFCLLCVNNNLSFFYVTVLACTPKWDWPVLGHDHSCSERCNQSSPNLWTICHLFPIFVLWFCFFLSSFFSQMSYYISTVGYRKGLVPTQRSEKGHTAFWQSFKKPVCKRLRIHPNEKGYKGQVG